MSLPEDGPNKVLRPTEGSHFDEIGIPRPTLCIPCEDSSGDLVPSIGSSSLEKSGPIDVLYQQSVPGWDSNFIEIEAGNEEDDATRFATESDELEVINDSYVALAYISWAAQPDGWAPSFFGTRHPEDDFNQENRLFAAGDPFTLTISSPPSRHGASSIPHTYFDGEMFDERAGINDVKPYLISARKDTEVYSLETNLGIATVDGWEESSEFNRRHGIGALADWERCLNIKCNLAAWWVGSDLNNLINSGLLNRGKILEVLKWIKRDESTSLNRKTFGFNFHGVSSRWGHRWSAARVSSLNNNIYCPPLDADKAIIIDVEEESVESTDFGLDLDVDEKINLWKSIVESDDKKLYCAPYTSDYVLVIDPENNTASLENFDIDLSSEFDTHRNHPLKWFDAAISDDTGKIYCIPEEALDLLIIDTKTGTAERKDFDLVLDDNTEKWGAIVYAGNGKFYCCPDHEDNVLVIDENKGTAEKKTFGLDFSDHGWRGGIKHSNGNIYFAPRFGNYILKINPEEESASLLQFGIGEGDYSRPDRGGPRIDQAVNYNTISEGADGRLYMFPRSDDVHVLIVDPSTGEGRRENYGLSIWGISSSVSFSNPSIYGIPRTTDALHVINIDYDPGPQKYDCPDINIYRMRAFNKEINDYVYWFSPFFDANAERYEGSGELIDIVISNVVGPIGN